jgi:CheY-specific phosphatase CheX
MNNSAEKILYRKAVLIFEELGFLMPCSNSGEYTSEEDLKTAMVSFTGAFSGCLFVSVSSALLPLLYSNMIGEEGDNTHLLEQDTLCEIANIICGNVLPAIYGFKLVFHLDAPVLFNESNLSQINSTFKEVSRAHIGFDSGRAEVALFADSSSAAVS